MVKPGRNHIHQGTGKERAQGGRKDRWPEDFRLGSTESECLMAKLAVGC